MIIKKLEEMKVENEMNNKITYHQEGDYLIPDIKLPEENSKYKNKTIGKFPLLYILVIISFIYLFPSILY